MATGYTRTQPSLPWQGRSPIAQQSSYEAALRAAETAPMWLAVLRAYLHARGRFGATDAEIEIELGWPCNIVTARRNQLVRTGEVVVRWPSPRRPTVKGTTTRGRKPLNVVVWMSSAWARNDSDTTPGRLET